MSNDFPGTPLTDIYGDILPDAANAPLTSIAALPTMDGGPSRNRSRYIVGGGAAVFGVIVVALGAFFWAAGASLPDPGLKTPATLTQEGVSGVAHTTAAMTTASTVASTAIAATATPNPAIIADFAAAKKAFESGDPATCVTHMETVVATDPNYNGAAVAYLFVCYEATAEQQADAATPTGEPDLTEMSKAETSYNQALDLYNRSKILLEAQFKNNPSLVPPGYSDFANWSPRLAILKNAATNYVNGLKQANAENYTSAVVVFQDLYDAFSQPDNLYPPQKGKGSDVALRRQLVKALYGAATKQTCKISHDAAAAQKDIDAARAVVNDGNGDFDAATIKLLDTAATDIQTTQCKVTG